MPDFDQNQDQAQTGLWDSDLLTDSTSQDGGSGAGSTPNHFDAIQDDQPDTIDPSTVVNQGPPNPDAPWALDPSDNHVVCDPGNGQMVNTYPNWGGAVSETPGSSCVDSAGNQMTIPTPAPSPGSSPQYPGQIGVCHTDPTTQDYSTSPAVAPTPQRPGQQTEARSVTEEEQQQFEAQDKAKKEMEGCETLPAPASEQCKNIVKQTPGFSPLSYFDENNPALEREEGVASGPQYIQGTGQPYTPAPAPPIFE